MVPQKSKKSKKLEISVFGGSPQSEAVEKVELVCFVLGHFFACFVWGSLVGCFVWGLVLLRLGSRLWLLRLGSLLWLLLSWVVSLGAFFLFGSVLNDLVIRIFNLLRRWAPAKH